MSGVPPQPTALKILKGAKADRINRNEPKAPDKPITKPEWLSERACVEWDRLAPALERAGVISYFDSSMFALYCEAYARAERLTRLAQHAPVYVPGRQGSYIRNPLFSELRHAVTEVWRLAKEFGLTPSARQGIRVELVLPDNDSRRLLNNGHDVIDA